jgi:PBP1b-binding outer membrane lipoprotein LpoB
MKVTLYIVLLGMLVAACGSNQPDASSSPAEQTAAEEQTTVVAEKQPLNWATKPLVEKQLFMKEEVVPAMGELFLPMHPDFQCSTCHGETYQEVKFKMPNTLKPLDPANMPFQSADEKMRNAAQFMMAKVVPRMAGLLEQSPYNPETKTGFGCFNCHATKPAM